MPLEFEQGYLEYSLITSALDFKDRYGKEELAKYLNLALTQIGLEVVVK